LSLCESQRTRTVCRGAWPATHGPGAAGRGQAAPVSPVKARFASADSSELITVVASEASKVRPTFLQARSASLSTERSPGEAAASTLTASLWRVRQTPRDTGRAAGAPAVLRRAWRDALHHATRSMHRGPSIARSGSVTALPHVAASHAPAPRAQLTDIAQWGSAEDTARLLLPRGARLLSAAAAAVPQAPRDTGTPAGLVQPPPCTVYRCALDWSARQQASMLDAPSTGWVRAGSNPILQALSTLLQREPWLPAGGSERGAEQPPRIRARRASSSPASPCAARALARSARPRRAAGTSSACPMACT